MILTVLQIHDTTHQIASGIKYTPYKQNVWFWIALAEALALLLLINLKYKRKNETEFDEQLITDSKKSDVDMGNVLKSIYQSKALYDKLKIKCHPDRFIGDPKHQIAEDIFQKISDNERNYEKLNQLKTRAINELNINF